jgi:hypothetical protein
MRAGRYKVEIAIMREMGWSWPELQAAPADLIEELVWRIASEREFQDEKRRREAEQKKPARPPQKGKAR